MLLKISNELLLFRRFSKLRHCLSIDLNRFYSSNNKQESYFSAIGGQSDEPPPDLTQQQVNTILRTNEMTILNSVKPIKLIESNQLASNHPIEDRLRISRFNFKALSAINNDNQLTNSSSDSIALAVFDGHGGGSCADVISRRLFHYIALSLLPNIETFNKSDLETFVQNLLHCPNPNHNITSLYEDRAAEYLKKTLIESERKALEKYVEDIKPTNDISSAIENAFIRCDSDLSNEIEQNLLSSSSNILLHYYLSLAVSGCCVTLLLIHNDIAYVASTGDCRAVLGFKIPSSKGSTLKTIDLSKEHNSDNLTELKRVYSEHPKSEQNNIVRDNRLLGQLMPLRAFGDFSFKWTIEKMKKLGLTRAFGSHVIPPYYLTPPYLTCRPEIQQFSLIGDYTEFEKFIILATDGLWEQFESPRKVVKCVNRYKESLKKQEPNDSKDGIKFEENQNLGEINDILKARAKPPITSFDEVTAEDDLIDDTNCATFLIRTALGGSPADAHLDQHQQQKQQHSRLVTYLTLPQSVVRNFRDDISLIVIDLN